MATYDYWNGTAWVTRTKADAGSTPVTPSTNLMFDPYFEDTAAWAFTGTATNSVSLIQTPPTSTPSWIVTANGTTCQLSNAASGLTRLSQVVPNATYQFSVWIKSSITATLASKLYINIDWYTSDGTLITPEISYQAYTDGGNWLQTVFLANAPANAVYASFTFAIDAAMTSGTTLAFAFPCVQPMVTNSLLADNAVQSENIATGAVISDKVSAGAITADKLTVGTPINIVADPNFSRVITGGWNAVSWASFGPVANVGYYGTGSIAFHGVTLGTVSSTLLNDAASWNLSPVIPDSMYRMMAWVKSSVSTSDVEVFGRWISLDGTTEEWVIGGTLVANTYKKFEAPILCPAGKTLVSFGIRTKTTLAAGTDIWMSDPTIKPMIDGTLIVDGSITAGMIQAGQISTNHISSISGSVIIDNTLDAAKIKANTITVGQLDTNTSGAVSNANSLADVYKVGTAALVAPAKPHVRIDSTGVTIAQDQAELNRLSLSSSAINFYVSTYGAGPVASITAGSGPNDNKMIIPKANITEEFQVGNHVIQKYSGMTVIKLVI